MNLINKLQENSITKEELLENIEIKNTCPDDIFEMMRILTLNMGVNDIVMSTHQIVDTNVQLNDSVKVVDKRDGKIYGVLLLSKFPIHKGSPYMMFDRKACEILKEYNQLNGFLFIIDERLRGTNVDRDMIRFAMPYIEKYDFIWVAVEKTLKSHNYWKHMGMFELLEIEDAIFYGKIINKQIFSTIYKKYSEKVND